MADLNSSAASASGDHKSSRSQGPVPKISNKQIVFSISARQKQSEARFTISSFAADPPYAYKIKTTAPKRFCVRPNQGLLAPGQTVEVSVSFLHDKILQESQIKVFNFNLIAQTMAKDKFLVQTVALTPQDEEYPPAQVAQLNQDAVVFEQQGNKKEADAAKAKADALQHEQWDAFKRATPTRVSDSKIGLNFVEASRASSLSEDDGAKSNHSQLPPSSRSNANASPHEAGSGNSVVKTAAAGLGRGASVAGDEGVSAEILAADNLRLRNQMESQREVLAATTDALENLKAQIDMRSRRSAESMSEAEIAKAASSGAATVYDKKADMQSKSSASLTVQVFIHPPVAALSCVCANMLWFSRSSQILLAFVILIIGIICGRTFGA